MIKQVFFSLGILFVFSAMNIMLRKKTNAFIPFSLMQFFIGYGICVTILIDPQMGSTFQHLSKTTAPFQYLYGPFFYFFWLYMFRPDRKWQSYDWLHALPFLLCVINYLPYYLLSAEEKLMIAREGNFERNTLFQIPYEYIFKLSIISIYAIAAFIPYQQSIWVTIQRSSKRNKFIARWMTLDLLLKLCSLLAIFINETFLIGKNYFNPAYLLYSVDSLMNIFIIHLFPFVMRGFRGTLPKTYGRSDQQLSSPNLADEQSLTNKENELLLKLKDILEVGQLFTDEEASARMLAKKISCSEAKLEEIVHKNFQMNVYELVQSYRINFLTELEKTEAVKQSMDKEGIAAMLGFKTQIEMEAAKRKFGPSKN